MVQELENGKLEDILKSLEKSQKERKEKLSMDLTPKLRQKLAKDKYEVGIKIRYIYFVILNQKLCELRKQNKKLKWNAVYQEETEAKYFNNKYFPKHLKKYFEFINNIA